MSFVTKRPKTTSRKKMVTRQQISDILSYGHIITEISFAKHTQIFLEKLITIAKKDTLIARRRAAAVLITTKKFSRDDLVKRLFVLVAEKYLNRPGGYSRRLKTEKGILIQLV